MLGRLLVIRQATSPLPPTPAVTSPMTDPSHPRGGRLDPVSHLKVTISLLWYLGALLSRRLARLAGHRPEPRFVVLYYHEVPNGCRAGFARQMRALSRSASVVRAGHVGPLPDGDLHVAITFDDAFRSVRVNAVPELLSRGFPATIFVPVGCLGQTAGWDTAAEVDDRVMTREELQSLPDLVELGSHSLHHSHLTKLGVPFLREEVATSRQRLSQLASRDISLLAFPYGEFDARVVQICSEAGYERVFCIAPALADPCGRDFVRGRVAVSPTDGPLLFHLKSHGGYEWMIHASALKRRLMRLRRSR